jgi:uncharacterized lipoprotein YddW (UPF0748 family)
LTRFLFALPWLLLPAQACAAAAELRGVWVDRSSLVSRAEIRKTMQTLAAAHFNAAYVNVWSRGYPLFPSRVFEAETGIIGDPGLPGRDVLRESIEEACAVGIAVIPWAEYGFIGGYSHYFPGEGGRGPIFARHPEWLARTASGDEKFPIAGAPGQFYFYLSHLRPDVQAFLRAMMAEIVERYEVPGVQFDRARLPQLDVGYDEYTVDLHKREHAGAAPPANPADAAWLRWRADKLNLFHDELYRTMKAADLSTVVNDAPTVTPFGYTNFAQDYPSWMRQRSVDYVVPQIYRRTAADYEAELVRQLAAVPVSVPLIPGIDITNSRDSADLVRQIEITRARGLKGVVVWYYRGLEQAQAFTALRAGVFSEKADLPWKMTPRCATN